MKSCDSGSLQPNLVALANPHTPDVKHANATVFEQRQLNVRVGASAPNGIEFQ